ncbi:hypothetical protein OHC33_001458 [Knufia fluminis]|uniref:NACHT domain-containing protein n=1 Tax=Knufia fluminis TaxID=191047 RepID=A0AAN8EJ70_9EURO|nr:hypothetical protein OHC33_001458 [Knufia fluminis]
MTSGRAFDDSFLLLQLANRAKARLDSSRCRNGAVSREVNRLITFLKDSLTAVERELSNDHGSHERVLTLKFIRSLDSSDLSTSDVQAAENGDHALLVPDLSYRQSYGNTTVADNATALLGNHYQYHNEFQIDKATFITPNSSAVTAYPTSRLREKIYNILSDTTVDDDLAEWLSSDDYHKHHNDTFVGVQQGTGTWFLQSDEYRRWLERSGQNLVLSGIPGAGKTCLVSIIIDDLRKMYPDGANVPVLYFYNSFRRGHEQTAASIISCLLRQAFLTNPAAGRPVHDLYEQHLKKGRYSQPSVAELLHALGAILNTCSRSFLIFDALDECTVAGNDYRVERTLVLETLSALQRASKTSILLTTRPTQDDLTMLPQLTRLTIRANDSDIAAYVTLRLARSDKEMFKQEAFCAEVRSKIVTSAQGMFLLAKLQMDSVLAQTKRRTVQRITSSISNADDTLQAAYRDTLERIKHAPLSDLAGRALACVVFSQRTLTLEEVRHALGIETGMDDIDDDDLDDVQDLLDSCAGLLTLDEEGDTLRVAHSTTQTFFEGLSDPWFTQHYSFLAYACALYLSMKGIVQHVLGGVGPEKSLIASARKRYPFLTYALQSWFHHLRSQQDDERLLWTALQAVKHDTIVKLAMYETGPSTTSSTSSTTSLSDPAGSKWKLERSGRWMHLLAWLDRSELLDLGARHVVDDTGSLDLEIEVKDPQSTTEQRQIVADCEDAFKNCPIVYASASGNLSLVEKLHQWSQHPPGVWNEQLEKALYQAVRHEHQHVIVWIVAHVRGASMPFKLDYEEILDVAIQKRSPAMCAKLLEIQHSPGNMFNSTLFTRAGSVGSVEIVDMLLAECNADNDTGVRFILTAAATSIGSDPGRLDVVKRVLLQLSHGKHTEMSSRLLLPIACSNGFMDLYEHLLTYPELDFDGKDEDGETALMRACSGDGIIHMSDEAARGFLTSLCQRSSLDYQHPDDGCTALHYAALRVGRRDNKFHLISDVLRHHGANDNIKNNEGFTAMDLVKETLKGPEALEAIREESRDAAREADKQRWRRKNIRRVWKSRMLVEDSGESQTDDEDYQRRLQEINTATACAGAQPSAVGKTSRGPKRKRTR